jgi:hypothetical protein
MKLSNPIIVSFPRGTGGKFLINCIGLSDQAVLSDCGLMIKQLNYQLSSQDKLDILLERISQVGNQWDDLNFSMLKLINPYIDVSNFNIKDITFKEKVFVDVESVPCLELLKKSKKFFCIESHNIDETIYLFNLLEGATIILFKENYNKFLNYRYFDLISWTNIKWKKLRGSDWPVTPPKNMKEYHLLPVTIQNELYNFIQHQTVSEWPISNLYHTNYLTWDANCYLDENIFLKNIKNLYKVLGLTDFNKKIIRTYYRSWINKLNQIKINNTITM